MADQNQHVTTMNRDSDQYDSPWKEALEVYLPSILELCFPDVANAIDWNSPVEFLDKELQKVVRDAALGVQRVDKLVRVKLRDGIEEWILVHVEVQHRPDIQLPLRVYQYHHRVRDRFGRRVLSLAILADEQPDWRPSRYEESILGCRVQFDFPICKLLDLVAVAQRTVARGKPSAVIVLANWAAQQTSQDTMERSRVKWDLTRRMFEAGFGKKDVLELFRLIDWLLGLPSELEQDFKQKVRHYEESTFMPYVTSIERLAKEEGRSEGWNQGREEGREEGRQEGRQEGREEGRAEIVLRLLRRRWEPLPAGMEERIRVLSLEQLADLAETIFDFTLLAEVETWLSTHAGRGS